MRRFKGEILLKSIMVILVLSVFILTSIIPAGATTSDYQIGIFWIPRADYNNATQYDYIRDANVNYVINVDNPDSNGIRTIAQNTTALDFCAERGMTFVAADTGWNTYGVNTGNATDAQIDSLASSYKNHSALGGYYVRDEPTIDMFPGLAREYNRFLYNSPNSIPYVNLFPLIAAAAPPVQSTSQTATGSGYYVTPDNSLGQTFTTALDCDYIDYIEMYIDANQWSTYETLTLTLWNSPSKTTKIALGMLDVSNNGFYPRFSLTSKVSPNTSYYMELTHSGGGDNSVGWVVSSSADVYSNGTAYQNGSALTNNDFYFKVFKNRILGVNNSVNQLIEGDGGYVNATTTFGQTFKTPSALNRRLQFIELHIDKNTWDSSEWLAMDIYDSPSRNQKLGKYAMTTTGNGNGYTPRFYLDADLKPNTTYYFELTYSGSNSVGWVTRSTSNVYADGSAYINGVAQTNDLYFRANFLGQGQDYLESWVNAVGASNLKYLFLDRYPFGPGTGICTDYFQGLEHLRNVGLQKNVKTGWFLQSMGIPDAYRQPNANEMRYNVYTAVAYGNKMLNWFTWWTPTNQGETFQNAIIDPYGNKTAMYTPVQTLNGEVKKLGSTLIGLTSQAVYHSGVQHLGVQSVPNNFWWKSASSSDNLIISYFKNASGRKYIMVVNRDLTNTSTFTFNVNPKPTAVTEVSKSTGAEVNTNYNSSTGAIADSFLPGEGKLYALPSGY